MPCPTCGPSHYYVRFKPADIDRLIDLEEAGYDLWDEPLTETDIASAGRSSATQSEDIPWLYTAVPVGMALPSHIQTEVLDQLFLWDEDAGDENDPEDPWEPEPDPCHFYDPSCGCYVTCRRAYRENAILKSMKALKEANINPLALYNEAMRISGNEGEMVDPAEAQAQRTGRRYNPAGTVMIDETALGVQVPLRGVKVKARRWFKMDNTYTNAAGGFSISKGFRQKAAVLVKFKNARASVRGIIGTFRAWEYVQVLKHKLGTYTREGMQNISFNFSYSPDAGSRPAAHWVAGTYFNSMWDAHDFSAVNQIAAPPAGLNVWVSSAVTAEASAPMARRVLETSALSAFIDLFLVGTGHPELAAIKRILQRLAPDITCRYGSQTANTRGYNELYDTFTHELGHAMHYSRVGNNYWAAYAGYIVANGGYGNKTTNGSGRIAVSEAWGFYVGNTMTANNYETTSANLLRFHTDFLEFQFPGDTEWWEWIVYGMFHDMTDNGEPPNTGVIDNVNTYTPNQLFSGLRENVTTVRGYQQEVLNGNNNQQAAQVDQLVTSYRY